MPTNPRQSLLNTPAEVHSTAYGLILGYASTTPHARIGGVVIAGVLATAKARSDLRSEPQYATGAFPLGVLCGLLHRYYHHHHRH